jgi:thioesterase domain-containing protein
MGGWIAVEVARCLLALNKKVSFVGLMDSGFLQFAETDTQKEAELFNWYLEDIVPHIPGPVRKLVEFVAKHATTNTLVSAWSSAEARPQSWTADNVAELRLSFETFKQNVRLLRGYRLQLCETATTLFRTGKATDEDSQLVLRGCHLVEIPGDHHSIMRSPNVENLARGLNAALAQASTRPENTTLHLRQGKQ